nr:MAG TPA: hypothetical protein [Caudoviricetes sp.]
MSIWLIQLNKKAGYSTKSKKSVNNYKTIEQRLDNQNN